VDNISFVTESGIQHHADFSVFGLSSDFQGVITASTVTTTYITGGTLTRNFFSDTKPIVKQVTDASVGSNQLTLTNVTGLVSGWEGNGVWTGRYITTITPPYTLTMSNTPSGAPTIGGNVTFSTSTNEVTLSGTSPTANLGVNWTIVGNGYTLGQNAKINSIKNASTIVVNVLPASDPQVGSPMTFKSPESANTLTVSSSAGLLVGWKINNNGFTNNQVITNISGNRITLSAGPNGTPVENTSITFISTATLYSLPVNSSVSFNLNYTKTTVTPNTYKSVMTINLTQNSLPVILTVPNFVGVGNAPIVTPSDNYTGNGSGYIGSNGGGPGGGGDKRGSVTVGATRTGYVTVSGDLGADGKTTVAVIGKDSSMEGDNSSGATVGGVSASDGGNSGGNFGGGFGTGGEGGASSGGQGGVGGASSGGQGGEGGTGGGGQGSGGGDGGGGGGSGGG